MPEELNHLGDVTYVGTIESSQDSFSAQGHVSTDAGAVDVVLHKKGSTFVGSIDTDGLSIQRILDDNRFGNISAHVKLEGTSLNSQFLATSDLKLKGSIPQFDYQQYTYNNIDFEGTLRQGTFDGQIAIDDPNAQLNLWGSVAGLGGKPLRPHAQITADIQHLRPSALRITNRWGEDADLTFNISADIVGRRPAEANGYVNIGQFRMTTPIDTLAIDNLHLAADHQDKYHSLSLESPFADLEVTGQFDYNTISESIASIVASKLPTLPGLPRNRAMSHNNFSLSANISQSQWLQQLLGIPITPMQLDAHISDQQHKITLEATLPHFSYNGNQYRDLNLSISTPNDTLKANATINRVSDSGRRLQLILNADAADNHLAAALQFSNNAQQPMMGQINADARFFKNENGTDAAHVDIHTSDFTIGDTQWKVEPGTIVYSKDDLTIDHLAVKSGMQHLTIDGQQHWRAIRSLWTLLILT